MSIPLSAMETPEVVWATADDTLEQVRDQLVRRRPENRWQSCVLVRDDEGRYAVVPVLDLRCITWEQGPYTLKQPLHQLLPLKFQAGVELDAIEFTEAAQLADQMGGWLVVLHGGRYLGLVPGRRGVLDVAVPPHDAFDLFDELLPDSVLGQTEFVTTTLHTTLAQVALALKSAHEPENAYLVIRMDDGSFRVIASRELGEQILQADGDLWRLPLRQFVARPWDMEAQVRERGTVGRHQAQKLLDRGRYLVVTEGGDPVGLLVSQTTWRKASLLGAAAHGRSVYDLFNVPEDLLRGYDPEPALRHEPRFVNLWFEDAEHKVVERSRPLVVGRTFQLALNVGLLCEDSLVDWGRSPDGPQAIVEPQQREAFLYVSLFSEDFYIPEPTKPLRLPKEGDTEPVRFEISPLRSSRGADLAKLEVCLYYRAYLVQTFEVYAEVVTNGQTASTTKAQFAELTHARTASFPKMEELPPRELSLTIIRDGADRYRINFLVDPDADDEAAAARAVELSCSVRLTRDDLTHLITKARRQLYNVVRAFDLLQNADAGTYQKATRALAQVGRQLYLKLFESSSAQALKDWMETSLPDGSTVQVVDLAGDFVFPWSLVYTAQPWDGEAPVAVEKFWGWRYKLVILTDSLLDTYRQAGTEIATTDPLRVSVGMCEHLVGAAAQKGFFANLTAATNQRVLSEILTSRRDMGQALAAADRDFYYFFCHGYTERIATDIQLDADLLSHFAQLAAGSPGAESGSLREHLDDLFDVSDSWIRLTQGKLPLAMLKETVPGQFSAHPVVFLNMCQSAQVLPSLSDGFVPFFIQRGVRAVVGTECSMNTIFADEFARAFLTQFFQGAAAGELLLDLRRQYLAQGNPLALAYTLYCDADLRLAEPLLSAGQTIAVEAIGGRPETEALREAVEALWENDVDGLMLTLAARVRAQEQDVARGELDLWDPPDEAFAADVEAAPEWTEAMIALGQRWWDKLEPKLFDLLCNRNNDEHNTLLEALKEGVKVLAIALAPTLVAEVSTLPAIAIVLATIAAKKVAEAGLETMCEMWTEEMIEDDQPSEMEPTPVPEPDPEIAPAPALEPAPAPAAAPIPMPEPEPGPEPLPNPSPTPALAPGTAPKPRRTRAPTPD